MLPAPPTFGAAPAPAPQQPTTTTPPGWYVDPWGGPCDLRWWSGIDWTVHVAPDPAAPVQAMPRAQARATTPSPQRRAYHGAGVDPHEASLAADIPGDTFELVQQVRLVTNRYEVYRTDAAGGREALVAFVRQKTLAMKERIDVWDDASATSRIASVRARSVVDLRATYDVVAGDGGALLGSIRRRLGRSLVRTTWDVMGRDGSPVLVVEETSLPIALLRRVKELLGIIPVVGPVLELLPIPYGFTLRAPDGRLVGTHTRAFALRDRYRLDLTPDTDRTLDRRLAISLAICLDALQSR